MGRGFLVWVGRFTWNTNIFFLGLIGRHANEARVYEAEAKAKLWSNHEAEVEAEALAFSKHEAEAEAQVLPSYYK